MNKNILIVGAGLSGSVLADKHANDGDNVTIIDKRNHIGGNVFDYYQEDGLLISKYGAHIFHTSDQEVWDYVNQFTTWLPYQHKVVSNVEGKIVPIPINIDTVNKLLGTDIK